MISARDSINSVLQLFALLLFASASVFFFVLPNAPELRILLSHAMIAEESFWMKGGIAFALLASIFLLGFWGVNRGYYLVLKMGKNILSIDEKVLFQTIEPELRKQVHELRLEQVSIMRKKEIVFTMSAKTSSLELQETLLLDAEKCLTVILSERFGYRRPFKVKFFSPANE